jgi:hypothetical protein
MLACCWLKRVEKLQREGKEGELNKERERRTGDETWEEWLLGKIGVVLLKMLLCCDKGLDCYELEATLLEASDDVADKSTLRYIISFCSLFPISLGMLWVYVYLDTIWLDGNEAM